jgi:hypothetical protein
MASLALSTMHCEPLVVSTRIMTIDNRRSNVIFRPGVKTEGKIKGRGYMGSKSGMRLLI